MSVFSNSTGSQLPGTQPPRRRNIAQGEPAGSGSQVFTGYLGHISYLLRLGFFGKMRMKIIQS